MIFKDEPRTSDCAKINRTVLIRFIGVVPTACRRAAAMTARGCPAIVSMRRTVIGCGEPVRAQLLYDFQPECVPRRLRSLLHGFAPPYVADRTEHLHLLNQY